MAYAPPVAPPTPSTQEFTAPNRLRVITYVGDLSTIKNADAVVTGEGKSFEYEGYITQALLNISPMDFAQKRLALKNKAKAFKSWTVHENKLPSPFPFQFVYHAILGPLEGKWVKKMRKLYKSTFKKAEKHGVRTLILPCLGSGRANASVSEAVQAVVESIVDFKNIQSLTTVYLLTTEKRTAEMMAIQCKYCFSPEYEPRVKGILSLLSCGGSKSKARDTYECNKPLSRNPCDDNGLPSHPETTQIKERTSSRDIPSSTNTRDEGYYSANTRKPKGKARASLEHETFNNLADEPFTHGRDWETGNKKRSDSPPVRQHSLDSPSRAETFDQKAKPVNKRTQSQTWSYNMREYTQSTHKNTKHETYPERHRIATDSLHNASSHDSTVKQQDLIRRQRAPAEPQTAGPAKHPTTGTNKSNDPLKGYVSESDRKDQLNQGHLEYFVSETATVEVGRKTVESPDKRKDPGNAPERRETTKAKETRETSNTHKNVNESVTREPLKDRRQPKQTDIVTNAEITNRRDQTTGMAGGRTAEKRRDSNKQKEEIRNKVESVKMLDLSISRNCPICISPITDPKWLKKCGHVFCKDCIDNSFKQYKPVCPSCGMVYAVLTGDQPEGNMDVGFSGDHLPGYEGHGTISITYYFPSGIQQENHPNPGQQYKGTTRRAYLPDCPEGREVLKLLKIAFEQKLTFTIGRSTTTGQENVVTWNDIHHKTNMDGGPTRFGYPDPGYLGRVKDELASRGVKEKIETTF